MARERLYNVVRFYERAGIRKRIILEGVTLEQAQKHCNDPETSASTCTNWVGLARTRKTGFWFDGYTEQ